MTKQTFKLDVRRLIQYLKSTERSSEEERWLHTQPSSQELEDGLRSLGHAVFPEKLCRVYADALLAYVHLKAMGANAEAEYPHVKEHLDLCVRCSGEYEDLYRMVSAAYADQVPVAPSHPTFDLSFLPQPVKSKRPDWSRLWEDVTSAGARVHRLITEVVISLVTAPFAPLTAPLRPALVTIPVPVQRKQDILAAGAETIKVLDLKYPPANLLIRVGRGPAVAQKTALVIDVLQMEPFQPIPATRVALYDERHRLLERIGTDAAGNVRFENVETGRYFIQVHYVGDTWEFPLLLDR